MGVLSAPGDIVTHLSTVSMLAKFSAFHSFKTIAQILNSGLLLNHLRLVTGALLECMEKGRPELDSGTQCRLKNILFWIGIF